MNTAEERFLKFPSIEQFHTMYRDVMRKPEYVPASIDYTAKVKLHGTNAAVGISADGGVFAQKRTSLCTPEADNAGFAAWVKSTEEYWKTLPKGIRVYGEWAGPGIQKGVGISKIPDKYFFVIAVEKDGLFQILPNAISKILGELPPRVLILQTEVISERVNLFDKESATTLTSAANKVVEDIDKECPIAKRYFGVEGPGEGLVFYPLSMGVDGWIGLETFGRYSFKVKGASHQEANKDAAAPAKLSAVAIAHNNEFIGKFATEDRLEKIFVDYLHSEKDLAKMGEFLKHFVGDVHRESRAEVEQNNLDWKQLSKSVSGVARNWYVNKVKTL